MFDAAKQALRDVIRFNDRLMNSWTWIGSSIRCGPLQALRVGRQEYRRKRRGFSGINEIDLLSACAGRRPLLCTTAGRQDAVHAAVRSGAAADCMTRTSLLDELLALADQHADADWFSRTRARTRGLRSVRAGGGAAPRRPRQAFIERPAPISTSGPWRNHGQRAAAAGAVALAEVLRDLRLAADRRDIATRYTISASFAASSKHTKGVGHARDARMRIQEIPQRS